MTELPREAVTAPEEKALRAATDPRPPGANPTKGIGLLGAAVGVLCLTSCDSGGGQSGSHIGGEANLQLPKLDSVSFLGLPGSVLLGLGLIVCALGLVFGIITYSQLNRMPVHTAMRDVSELIYTTCKTYLKQQGRFLLLLWAFIAAIIVIYYLFLVNFGVGRTAVVILFSLIGMGGSYAVAWYGIRVNTLANSRTAHAAMSGRPYPCHDIPLRSGMSIGMVLISVELAMMLVIMVFLPGEIAGSCFIGFAIGESLGASALRIAGGIFTKIADIGADLIEDRLPHQGGRRPQPRRDRRLHGRQCRRLRRPLGGRFRNLRRDRCGADHLHPPRGPGPDGAGAAAGVDLRDPRRDGGGLRDLVLRQRRHHPRPLPRRRRDGLRGAPDVAWCG